MDASIIIPFYNSSNSIEHCLSSLTKQKTKHSYEIIAVDDGSKDDGTEKVLGIAGKSRIKITLVEQENKGPSKARNNGARNAEGDILLFMDSDCEASEHWLDEMLKPFDKKDVLACQGAYLTKQKELMARFVQLEVEERYERMKKARKIDWVGSYSAAYRREVFEGHKGFDESFPKASGEDPDLSYKISKKGEIVFNPKATVYHLHPTDLMNYLKKKYVHAYYRVKLYSRHKDKAVKDSYTPQSLKLQIVFATLMITSIPITFAIPDFQYVGAISTVLFILSSLKSTIFNMKRDFGIGIATPAILFLRSIAFALGLIAGILKKVLG